MGPSGCWSLKTPGGVATNGALVLAGPGKQTLTAGIRPSLDLGFSPVAVTRGGRGSWSSLLPDPGFADVPDALAATAGGRLIALGLHQARPGRRPARSPPDPPPRQRELGRGSARSMPSRSRRPDWPALATVTMRLTSRAGDPAALEQAFVVLTAIIGLLTAGYAASLRLGVRRPEYDIYVSLPSRIAILCHEKITCRYVRRIKNLF